MNFVSACCMKEIITITKLEYPLGGSTWSQSFKVDVCEGCGQEIDYTIAVHECCGLEICECSPIDDAFEDLRRRSI